MMENVAFIKIPNGYRTLNLEHVIYLEADDNYTRVNVISSDNFMIPTNLGSVERLWTDMEFIFRIHKSFLINIHFLKEIRKEKGSENYHVHMENGHVLPLARRRRKELFSMLKKRW